MKEEFSIITVVLCNLSNNKIGSSRDKRCHIDTFSASKLTNLFITFKRWIPAFAGMTKYITPITFNPISAKIASNLFQGLI